ncbi:MAG: DUF4401 domain-containing protein [Sulfurovum sp.]|nr:DUF4401 domain-containing protein [Sulfurovum sp.]
MKHLWETLAKEQLVEAELSTGHEEHSPWYVQVLLAFSGWLAALFILGFLAAGLSDLFRNTTALLVLGSGMIFLAYFILKKEKSNFIEHLGLAISFAGQSLILVGLLKIGHEPTSFVLFILFALQLSLALVMPNYLHRLSSAFFTVLALSWLLTNLGISAITSPLVMAALSYLWIHEFSLASEIKKRQALGYGLVLALILIENSSLARESLFSLGYSASQLSFYLPYYLSPLLEGAVTLFVVLSLLKSHHIQKGSKVAMTALVSTILFILLGFEIPGLLLSILIILLAFNHSNRILLGLGIFSLLFSASSYYYWLENTLLEKSLLLALMGVVLLLGRWIVFHFLLPKKEVPDV